MELIASIDIIWKKYEREKRNDRVKSDDWIEKFTIFAILIFFFSWLYASLITIQRISQMGLKGFVEKIWYRKKER